MLLIRRFYGDFLSASPILIVIMPSLAKFPSRLYAGFLSNRYLVRLSPPILAKLFWYSRQPSSLRSLKIISLAVMGTVLNRPGSMDFLLFCLWMVGCCFPWRFPPNLTSSLYGNEPLLTPPILFIRYPVGSFFYLSIYPAPHPFFFFPFFCPFMPELFSFGPPVQMKFGSHRL